ncbi:MAG: hypothetical protein KC620_16490 [Myxococcales bacterium]|nr:hypothetical protein [Myxococcales bacterium]
MPAREGASIIGVGVGQDRAAAIASARADVAARLKAEVRSQSTVHTNETTCVNGEGDCGGEFVERFERTVSVDAAFAHAELIEVVDVVPVAEGLRATVALDRRSAQALLAPEMASRRAALAEGVAAVEGALSADDWAALSATCRDDARRGLAQVEGDALLLAVLAGEAGPAQDEATAFSTRASRALVRRDQRLAALGWRVEVGGAIPAAQRAAIAHGLTAALKRRGVLVGGPGDADLTLKITLSGTTRTLAGASLQMLRWQAEAPLPGVADRGEVEEGGADRESAWRRVARRAIDGIDAAIGPRLSGALCRSDAVASAASEGRADADDDGQDERSRRRMSLVLSGLQFKSLSRGDARRHAEALRAAFAASDRVALVTDGEVRRRLDQALAACLKRSTLERCRPALATSGEARRYVIGGATRRGERRETRLWLVDADGTTRAAADRSCRGCSAEAHRQQLAGLAAELLGSPAPDEPLAIWGLDGVRVGLRASEALPVEVLDGIRAAFEAGGATIQPDADGMLTVEAKGRCGALGQVDETWHGAECSVAVSVRNRRGRVLAAQRATASVPDVTAAKAIERSAATATREALVGVERALPRARKAWR